VKLVLDLNLSPSVATTLAHAGFEAVHWSAIGSKTAEDSEILSWARAQGFVVVTHDLDFSAILASSGEESPSVVQVRMQDVLSAAATALLVLALTTHADDIERGALLSVNESGTRVRVLPLRRD
jgi:predicted nuclease of predicted toxin-antitoxin system